MSSTAISAPRTISCPSPEYGPVIGATLPILMGSPDPPPPPLAVNVALQVFTASTATVVAEVVPLHAPPPAATP